MKKNLFLTSILISAGSLMAACGTAETTEQPTNSTAQEQPVEETEAPQTTEDAGISETPAEDETEVTEDLSRAATEGTLTASDEQSYEIRILPGFELTSEEPGKDSLILSEDSSVAMRIEAIPKADVSFDQAATSLRETVQASNSEEEVTEIDGPQGADFLNSIAYEIPTAEGKVTGIAFEKEDLIVRLTIFDSTDAAATADFMDMAKTIEPKK